MKWSDKHLHIVSFDVPYPPDYGGAIDVFYKLKAFAEAGIRVHLHCFQYGRPGSDKLRPFCESVSYYPRNVSKAQLFHKLPYIVVSRSDTSLLKNLSANGHPVLFEGLHSCFFLDHPHLKDRLKVVRTHNIEHDYYSSLAKVEANIFKRYYYHNEAQKLEEYESVLGQARHVAAISYNDLDWFAAHHGNAFYLPAFHAYEKVQISEGTGAYAFYHGNLSVGENNQAALYLVNRIFSRLTFPLVIAGRKPSRELKEAAAKHRHVTLVADPSHVEVIKLLSESQVNVLPTFQPTGIKLKLLSALFNGRYCLANSLMVNNTGLEELCLVADSEDDMVSRLTGLISRPFDASEIKRREERLGEGFSNKANIRKVLERLFP